MTIGDEAIFIFAIMWTFPRKTSEKSTRPTLNFDVTDCRFQLTVHNQFIKYKWKWEVIMDLQELQELLLWQMNILFCLTAGRISTFAFGMHPSSWFKAPNANKFWLNKFTISKLNKFTIGTRPSILCVTHRMSRKKRNYSAGWTVPYEMMNYKWYLMVLGQYMTLLASTWSV